MAELEFRVEDRKVREALAVALAKQDPELIRSLEEIGEHVQDEARKRAPKAARHVSRGMTLEQSIAFRMKAKGVVVRSNKRYAGLQEFGGTIRPHEIRPKRTGALAFNGIVVKRVSHPGGTIKGMRYLTGAVADAQDWINGKILDGVDRSLERLGHGRRT